MYPNQYKAMQNMRATPEGRIKHSETNSLRNLIKYCGPFITIESGSAKATYKNKSFESPSELRTLEWLLDERWGIKVKLLFLKPLKWEKEPGCGPILSSERAALSPKPTGPLYSLKLTIDERRLLISELERELIYMSPGDTKNTIIEILSKLQVDSLANT